VAAADKTGRALFDEVVARRKQLFPAEAHAVSEAHAACFLEGRPPIKLAAGA
jgi:hypothetical protein